jgi:hypothetical protein
MSLGCGPQAGNITSDNISAKHLINVKRAAFPRRDWAMLEQRDHERALALTKEQSMPRGSGMRGDPALASSAAPVSSSALTPDATSNWRGNPSMIESAMSSISSDTATPWRSKVGPAAKSTPPVSGFAQGTATLPAQGSGVTIKPASAPSPATNATGGSTNASSSPLVPFTTPALGRNPAATATLPETFTSAKKTAPGRSPYAGGALTPAEINTLMSHAGAGCPMGPCKGCPHNETTTGACLA